MSELARLLRSSEDQMKKYVVLPGVHERTALALFVAHTYAIEGAHATPYLLVTSPERESGKTRMLENLELQVAKPWRVTGASEAAMFRKIENVKPTLMLDEVDAIFGTFTERTEPLRGVLNAGNRPGAVVTRCEGDKHQVKDYSVYCPKVLAGIDTGRRIPETIRGRSIPIRMMRKTGSEKVEMFRHRFVEEECKPIRREFDAWALDIIDILLEAVPKLPEELGDRAAEGWDPLLAIADLAGGEWPFRAREAAVKLSAPNEESDQTYGAMILAAIKTMMDGKDRLPSAAICIGINVDEELPFGGWSDGRGLDQRTLAATLGVYGIHPKTIRVAGGTPKGYESKQFEEAWERWLPPEEPQQPQQPQQPQRDREQADSEPLHKAGVADVADVAVNRDGVAEQTLDTDAEAGLQPIAGKFA
jgi:hypothetical protein